MLRSARARSGFVPEVGPSRLLDDNLFDIEGPQITSKHVCLGGVRIFSVLCLILWLLALKKSYKSASYIAFERTGFIRVLLMNAYDSLCVSAGEATPWPPTIRCSKRPSRRRWSVEVEHPLQLIESDFGKEPWCDTVNSGLRNRSKKVMWCKVVPSNYR